MMNRAQIRREYPSTMENSQTIRVNPGFVGELNLEPGQIDLGLLARRSLEPYLERG